MKIQALLFSAPLLWLPLVPASCAETKTPTSRKTPAPMTSAPSSKKPVGGKLRITGIPDPGFKPVQAAIVRLEQTLGQAKQAPAVSCRIQSNDANGQPAIPESFALQLDKSGRGVEIQAADAVGLGYALNELAALAITEGSGKWQSKLPIRRSPHSRLRSLAFFPHNEEMEASFFHSPEYWDQYFGLMSRSRFNAFTLTFGAHTPYFSPPFPYWIEVPGFEKVKVSDLSVQDRERNLATLKMIVDTAQRWGIQFSLGIWQERTHAAQKTAVEGLLYEDVFTYGPKALAQILQECPGITAIQFRLNYESGIKPEDQARFYGAMMQSIKDCGREMRVELRGKGLLPATLEQATQKLGKFSVSTKFWCEQMGQPYFQTEIIPRDANNYRRYGYWDLLDQKRPYQMSIGLWTLGSQRVLSWADPAYAARIATSSALGQGPVKAAVSGPQEMLGYEVMAPLSHQGFGNYKGDKGGAVLRPEDKWFRWEFERYWPFFAAFGQMGYHTDPAQAVYSAEFRERFGKNGPAVLAALASASGVVPLHTATHAPSASMFAYWSEFEAGGLTDWNIRVPTGDPGRFSSINEFVGNVLKGNPGSKTSPLEIAVMLDGMADEALKQLKAAKASAPPTATAGDFHSLETDIQILAALGHYHAARRRAGVCYALFAAGKGGAWIEAAAREMDAAVEHWRTLVQWSAAYYSSNLAFNDPPFQVGHWKDELPLLEEEATRLHRIKDLFKQGAPYPAAPAKGWTERTWEVKFEQGKYSRWPSAAKSRGPVGPDVYETHQDQYAVATPEWLLANLPTAGPMPLDEAWLHPGARPAVSIVHTPVASCRPDQPLVISCEANAAVEKINVRFRPMVQTVAWQSKALTKQPDGSFRGTIASSAIQSKWPFMYAFEVFTQDGTSQFWPSWKEREPYFMVPVETN